MTSAFSIASSGLSVSTLQLEVSANNVANGLTNGFQPSRVDPAALAAGGVTASVQPSETSQADPVAAQMNSTIVALSGTDLVAETVNRQLALASFQANLATLKAVDADEKTLLSIHS